MEGVFVMKRRTLIFIIIGVLAVLLLALALLLPREAAIAVGDGIPRIGVTSAAFVEGGAIPVAYTGDGEDISPPFQLGKIADEGKSIAIIMEDLDIPLIGSYTHWTIWNLPPVEAIPEAIAHGEDVSGAVQGVGYGEHRYRGPKPPFGTHRYRFHFFVLDQVLALDASAGRAALLAAMEGHILQYGAITGWYPRAR